MSTLRWKSIWQLVLTVCTLPLFASEAHAAGPTITSLSPTSGPVGLSVTITGTNFGSTQGSGTVKFNGTTATTCNTCWSNTSISVLVPSGATTGNVVVNVGGVNSNGVNFTVAALPAGWTDSDIGSVGAAGSATFANGTFTVTSTGQMIWSTADSMNFVYQSLSGDGTIIARVVSTQGFSGFYGSAGAMIRETLNAGSTNAKTAYWPTYATTYFDDRSTTGGSTGEPGFQSVSVPTWVKITRAGSTFSAYVSATGSSWTPLGASQTINMAQNVYIGLAVASGGTSDTATATFDNVSINSTSAPAPIITNLSATTGAVGAQVIINGQNFGNTQSGSLVLLSGSPVTVNSWSGTAISITIPTGATSGPLAVSLGPSMNESNAIEFEVTTQPLPQPWVNQDVGFVGLQGSVTFANGSFTVNGAGAGISGTSDAFQFVYQTLTGDGSITARVSNIQGSSNTQAGVMIRERLDGNSTDTFVYFQPNSATMYYRTSAGASNSSQSVSFVSSAYPYWVRMVRSGDVFAAYISSDGINWVQVGSSQALTMAETLSIGMAVSSESLSSLSAVTFDNVSVNSAIAPAPTISGVSATTGSIGSQVSIYGTNFGATQNGSVVYLNGVPVTINSWASTAILITIPSGATSGSLGVCVAPSMNCSDTIRFTVTSQPLAATWLDQDISITGLVGSGTYSNGTFTIGGAGTGVNGTADGLHFVFQPLQGDGTIIARVANIPNTSSTMQIGLMIRETVNPGAASAFAWFYPNQAFFAVRTATGASVSTQNTSFTNAYYPYWVKLVRASNTFNAYVSSDGSNWTQIGTSQTVTMAQNVLIGMAVSNGTTSTLTTASFDSVSVSSDLLVPPTITSVSATTGNIGSQVSIFGTSFGPTQNGSMVVLNGSPVTISSWSDSAIGVTIPSGATSGYLEVLLAPNMNSSNPVSFTVTSQPLPVGWLDTDIGQNTTRGSATYSGSTFTVNAYGSGVNGTADGMHFVYQSLTGDGVIIARVSSITGANSTTQLGVMIRETLSSGATEVFVSFYPNQAVLWERTSTGGSTGSQATFFTGSVYPYWVKLARTGNTFNGYISNDGSTWTQVGTSQTITMAQTVYAGFGGSSQTQALLTASFDNVSVTPGTMPIISRVSPASGGIGTTVTVTGTSFGTSQGTSTIKFNGVAATSVTSWSNTQIVAAVPSSASTGPVTVVVSSISSNTNFSFTLYNPVVSSVSPPVGQYGSTIVVTGSGFGNSQTTGSQVSFNGASGNVISWSNTSIQVAVPQNATSGPLTVSVGGVTSNSISFSIESLSVTSISPSIGPAGGLVTITGSGFGATQTSSSVDFYGTSATVQSWSDTQIVAVVPAGMASGYTDVTVGGATAYGSQFTITKTVQVGDSLNHSSNYTSAMIGGMWVPTAVQGSGCSTCTLRGNISYTYDASGHPLSRTDENGNTTTYTYDGNGNVLTVTIPINATTSATTTYTYNSFGEVLTATDAMGNVTANAYDTKGNLLTVTTPAPAGGVTASVTSFTYDSMGELLTITDPLSNVTTLTYTTAGLINTIKDATNNVTTYGYDSQGNRTSVTDANNKQTTFTYDAMNRLTKVTYPDSTTTQFAYDSRGRRTSVTDQNSKVTTYAYDDADRLTTVTDAGNNVTTYSYDSENNLTSIKDASNSTTSFTYDAFGRVTKTTFPSGYIETYGYDSVGNLTSKTDRKNQQITYAYDKMNRLTAKTYPDNSAVNYTYDLDSRLTQVTDPTGTYSFTFDNMGRLTGTTTSYALLTGRNFTTAYGYDKASNRTNFTDPENGATTYAYDTLNRLQTLTPPSAFVSTGNFGFSYDALSRRTQMTRPNGVTTNYTYDNLSRLLSVLHQASGSTIDGVTYMVDNAGNRLTRTPQPSGPASNYTYDAIYELTQVTQASTTTESYTYDAVGNRLTALGSSTWTYNTSNELTARPGVTYTYDNNGNTTTKVDSTGTTTYSWDYENRLTSVTLPGSGGSISFKYDPSGRRIYKSSSAGTSIYAYDGDNLIEETNSAGSVVTRYSDGMNIDEQLIILRNGTSNYYQADMLGTITSLSTSAGAIAQTYSLDTFGNQTGSSGSLTNPFRYTGREFDTETSLYYYRSRYYIPQIGRFLNEDSMRFDAGINFYAYTLNSPSNFRDPDGMDIAVVENGPTSGNPIGHTAIAITGHGVYSFGNNTPCGSPLTSYLQREVSRRNTVVFIIKTTPAQDAAVLAQLNSWGKCDRKIPITFGNCSDISNHALNAGGIPPVPGWVFNNNPLFYMGLMPGSSGTRAGLAGGTAINIPQNSPSLPPSLQGFNPR